MYIYNNYCINCGQTIYNHCPTHLCVCYVCVYKKINMDTLYIYMSL